MSFTRRPFKSILPGVPCNFVPHSWVLSPKLFADLSYGHESEGPKTLGPMGGLCTYYNDSKFEHKSIWETEFQTWALQQVTHSIWFTKRDLQSFVFAGILWSQKTISGMVLGYVRVFLIQGILMVEEVLSSLLFNSFISILIWVIMRC